MEERVKRRVEVTIAGITMSLVTDESETFVNSIIKRMDETMSSLLNRGAKRSQLDAAMLCAIEFCGDKILAEKRVRNLEAQISLYDVNLRRLREENLSLRKKLEGDTPEAAAQAQKDESEPVIGEQISIGDSAGDRKPAADAVSPASHDGENADNTDGGSSRGDKLKMIEALLRK